MRITKVMIEGLHNVINKTYTFDDLTYLYGPNGAGKSTVLQAVQLALLGYIPGNSKASKEAIFRHANGHSIAITLELVDDDQVITISRVWSGTKSNIHSSVEIEPKGYDISQIVGDLELPIFNFNDFLDLTANKMKDWFIEFLPSSSVKIDWKTELLKDAESAGVDISNATFIDDVVAEINGLKSSGVDQIRDVNEFLKAGLSFKKKELERIQSTIQSLIFYDDISTEMTEAEVTAELESLAQQRKTYEETQLNAASNNRILAMLDQYSDCTELEASSDPRYIKACDESTRAVDDIAAHKQKVTELTNSSFELKAKLTELSDKYTELRVQKMSKESVLEGKGICPYTNTECESIQTLIKTYTKEVKDLSKQLSNLDKDMQSTKDAIADIDAKILASKKDIDMLNVVKIECANTTKMITDRYEAQKKLKTQLTIVPELDISIEDIYSRISELNDLQIKYAANRRYNELIDKLTKDKFKVEQEIIAYKSWINLTGVNGLQNDEDALKPFIDLQDTMNTYIQAVFGSEYRSKFNLESKANSFSFGVEHNNSYIPYTLLSSGEKCMYTLALMMSLTQMSKSALKLVIVDDLLDHLDDANILKLFESLEKVKDIQMIFAGVKAIDKDYVVTISAN